MPGKTIIIVHGIGEQLPGKTIDAFVDGLKANVSGIRILPEDTQDARGYRVSSGQGDVSVKEASWAGSSKHPYIWNVFWFFFRACQRSFAQVNLQYPFAACYQFTLAVLILLASLTLLTLWLFPLLLEYLLSFGAAENLAAAVLSGSFSGLLTAALISYVFTSANYYESDGAFGTFFLLFATFIIPVFILISIKTRKKEGQAKQAESSTSRLAKLGLIILGWITPPVVYFFGKPFDWAKRSLKFLSEPVKTSIVRVLGDIEIYVEDIDTARKIKDVVGRLLRESFGKADEDICFVGHSLGSVIIYETLCDLAEEGAELTKVKMIVTVGSPLNRVRYFWGQRRRFNRELPRHIRWYNYYSVGDFIGSYLTQFPERDIKNIRVANTVSPLPLWAHVKYWQNKFLMKDMWSRVVDVESLQPAPDENKWIGQAVVQWSFYGLLLLGLYQLGMIFFEKEWAKGFSILLPALLFTYMLWTLASRKLTEKESPPSDPWAVALATAEANLAKNPADPELQKAVSKAQRQYKLHRKIQRKTRITSWGISPLIILATAGWLWMRLFLCWSSSVGQWLGLFCSSSAAIPMAVVGGGFLLAFFILRDLLALGLESTPTAPYWRRIKTGYDSLAEPNRKSAKWIFGIFMALFFGMVLFMTGLKVFLSFSLFPF